MDALTTMELLKELSRISKKYNVVLEGGAIRPLYEHENKGGGEYGVFVNNSLEWTYPGYTQYPRKQVPLHFE